MATATKERLKRLIDELPDDAAEELEAALTDVAVEREQLEWHTAFGALHAALLATAGESAYNEQDFERAKSGQWNRAT